MDKKVIIAIVAIVALLVVGGAVAYFMRTPVTRLGDVVPFETVKKDFHGGVEAGENVAVTGEAEWTTLWNQMAANITPKPPVPAIDFSKEMVIGVFLGIKPTGGYSIEVTRIAESADRITVYVREVSPGPNCRVTEALTNPYHIVKIETSSKQVDFSVTKDVTECVGNI